MLMRPVHNYARVVMMCENEQNQIVIQMPYNIDLFKYIPRICIIYNFNKELYISEHDENTQRIALTPYNDF